MSWLKYHPINWKADSDSTLDIENVVKFVMQEMGKKKFLLEEYATNITKQVAELEGRWTGSIPLLCLIHTLIDNEEIRTTFMG